MIDLSSGGAGFAVGLAVVVAVVAIMATLAAIADRADAHNDEE